MKRNWIIIVGVVAASGCVVSIYFSYKRNRQNKRASEFIKELMQVLKPATAGLLAEPALDLGYKDEIVKNAGRQVIVLNDKVAEDYANQIKSAWNHWLRGGDNEQKLYAVFRALKDKVQVSQVANAYWRLNDRKVNLIDRLNERLDEKEIGNVLSIINPLPAFRTV